MFQEGNLLGAERRGLPKAEVAGPAFQLVDHLGMDGNHNTSSNSEDGPRDKWTPANLSLHEVMLISFGCFAGLVICILTIHFFVRRARRREMGLPSTRRRKGRGNVEPQLLSPDIASDPGKLSSLDERRHSALHSSPGGSLLKGSMHEERFSIARSNSTTKEQPPLVREGRWSIMRSNSTIRNQIMKEKDTGSDGSSGLQSPHIFYSPRVPQIRDSTSGTSVAIRIEKNASPQISLPSPAHSPQLHISSAESLPMPSQSMRNRIAMGNQYLSDAQKSPTTPTILSPVSPSIQSARSTRTRRSTPKDLDLQFPTRSYDPAYGPPSSPPPTSPPPPIPKTTEYIPQGRKRSQSNPTRPETLLPQQTRGHRPSLSSTNINTTSVSRLATVPYEINIGTMKSVEQSETNPPQVVRRQGSKKLRKTRSGHAREGSGSGPTFAMVKAGDTVRRSAPTPEDEAEDPSATTTENNIAYTTTSGWEPDTSSSEEVESRRKRKAKQKDLKGKGKR